MARLGLPLCELRSLWLSGRAFSFPCRDFSAGVFLYTEFCVQTLFSAIPYPAQAGYHCRSPACGMRSVPSGGFRWRICRGASRLSLHRSPGNLFGRRRGPTRPRRNGGGTPPAQGRGTRERNGKRRKSSGNTGTEPPAPRNTDMDTPRRGGSRHGDKRRETENPNSPVYEPAARPTSWAQSVESG